MELLRWWLLRDVYQQVKRRTQSIGSGIMTTCLRRVSHSIQLHKLLQSWTCHSKKTPASLERIWFRPCRHILVSIIEKIRLCSRWHRAMMKIIKPSKLAAKTTSLMLSGPASGLPLSLSRMELCLAIWKSSAIILKWVICSSTSTSHLIAFLAQTQQVLQKSSNPSIQLKTR